MKIIPPKYASENAKDALNCFKKGKKAMTKVGINRMYQLINREELNREDLMDIYKFKRHKKNAEFKGKPCDDRGFIAWKGWGLGYKDGKPNTRFSEWARRKLNEK